MKTAVWLRTGGMWLGLVIFAYSFTVGVSPWWYAVSGAVYWLIVTTITVGYHRLFTHSMFKCHRAWHWLFMYVGSASLHTSTVQWVSNHLTHHKFSDTVNDPHEKSWRYFFRLEPKRGIPWSTKRAKWMMRDPIHAVSYKYSGLIFLFTGIACFATSPNLFMFAFAIPVALSVFTSGFQVVHAHGKDAARDLPWMEFIFPIAGEWMHLHHHEYPADWKFSSKFWELDFGSYVIRKIRSD